MTNLQDTELRLSASQQLLARCVVFFHFSMFSWGMWIAIVLAAYWYRTSAAIMTLYLVYIFLYQGNRALHQHVYPQHCRRSALSTGCCSGHHTQTYVNGLKVLLCWSAGLVGSGLLHTSQLKCTRQQTLILLATTCLHATLTALQVSGKLCSKSL